MKAIKNRVRELLGSATRDSHYVEGTIASRIVTVMKRPGGKSSGSIRPAPCEPCGLKAYGHGMLLKGDKSQSENEITALMNQLLNFRPQHVIDSNGADRSVEIVKRLVSAP